MVPTLLLTGTHISASHASLFLITKMQANESKHVPQSRIPCNKHAVKASSARIGSSTPNRPLIGETESEGSEACSPIENSRLK